MKDDARGTIRITEERATGRVGFARTASGDLLPSVDARTATQAAAKAGAYLDEYATAFGARRGELRQTEVREARGGWTVEYAQSYRGVPVFAGELRAHVDRQGDLTAVNGFAVPGLDLDTTPRVSKADAAARAVRLVGASPSDKRTPGSAKGLEAVANDLMVYRMGTTRGVEGDAVLAWVVEVSNRSDVRETVILDARTGKKINRWSMIAHNLSRELYESKLAPANLVWKEGDAFPGGLDEDQAAEVAGAGETYWMFMNTFGRDSYDGQGAKMVTVNNDPAIRCPNANWNGVSTNYCSGVSSDDTVAHEWGHAYTEYTSGLIYQWQSGAMNEAYSDIWGETVDMLNDRYNETPDTKRIEGDCSVQSPPLISVEITAPANVAGPCEAVPASGGPTFTSEVLTPQVVVGLDAEDPEVDDVPTDGCSPFSNAAAIDGNWVFVDENLNTGCGEDSLAAYYEAVAGNAITAGAEGIIFGGDPEFAPWDMPGATFTIPALQVDGDSGTRFKTAGTSTARISASTTNTDESYRWLSGEADPAFGGAIRDMWNPNCYGDPGKVSDEEYYCDTTDAGGVHTNSGVVNHAYALLVDGSTYNGVTVPAIGLDKAANIFWQAQLEYLTPSSDFADLADALASSCTDLVGEDINEVTLGQSATGGSQATPELADPITTADCAAVDKASQAVELAKDPVQCNFGPLLAKNTPSLCGTGFTSKVTWSEDFEDGLAGWTQDEDVVYADEGATGIDWVPTTSAPGGHAGGVAFGADPTTGSCLADAEDISGRNGLISPSVTVPAGTSPRLTFDHYVATEAEYDGANVKASVNGGPFTVIPASAYVFNGPGAVLATAEEDNTNPMGGEVAFTGTDGGEINGSWGTSIIDLAAIAPAGASVKFRFDMGRDGCNGVDGWYVDNVKVQVCEKNATTPTPPNPPNPPAPDEKDQTRTKVKVKPVTVERGEQVKVVTVVKSRAGTPRGEVRVKVDGKKIDTVRLSKGRAVVTFKATWKPGKYTVKVTYLGTDNYKRSSDDARLRIKG
ncbi:Zn-dependent metalloprotease [Nocardioides cavernae]|uniref:Zn-dependent metalloprotease n=2 Tax=Nocardioides cavernae TaxID=1921566 RepID=A0A7Y9H2W3_9ACTN|nr:Zn-dependent metalloprotease [Nocardioides cavernae]